MTGIDLVDWTIENARHLEAERLEQNNAEDNATRKILAVLQGDTLAATSVAATPVERPADQVSSVERVEQTIAEHPPRDRPAQPLVEPQPAAAAQPVAPIPLEPHTALKKAILAPDIHTGKSDRYRAIELRWMLRDIRSKRTQWWPVSQHDLRVLLDMGLVEMRDDVLTLTNSGLDAIT